MKSPFPTEKLPTKPGCYLFKDKADSLIYIGKAKNIKKRVTSYFSKEHDDIKTAQLVENINSVDYIVTPSEVEALLLESNLIRQHKPKYNIDLKYGVRYAWIVLTKEKFPRLLTLRSKTMDGEYFGPFVSGTLRRTLLDALRKQFFIRTCRVLPKKPCLKYHIGACKAPCVDFQSEEDYNKNVEDMRTYLQGKNNDFVKELKQKMVDEAGKMNFESAQNYQRQIESLEYLQEQLLVEQEREDEQDVINYHVYEDKVKLQVFTFRRGVLTDKQSFTMAEEPELLDEFIKRYYEVAKPPEYIIIPHPLKDKTILDYLKSMNSKVKLIIPKKGMKKELLELVEENLMATMNEKERLQENFREVFGHPVRTIECFDISHLSGTHMVGAMVRFVDGKPQKSGYRKFKIKTVSGIDDFRAIKEIVARRYSKLLATKQQFPDLVVIDGGELQLTFAKRALEKLGLHEVPVIGLAKKFEEVYLPERKEPLRLDKKSPVMKVLINARNEAHRFGITYHRLLRKKGMLKE